MKKFLTLLFLVLSLNVFAQKSLPVDCPGLKEKLLLLQQSFADFESLKRTKINDLFGNKWTTDFTLCGLNGILEIDEDDNKLIFEFDGYTATAIEIKTFVTNIRKKINEVFSKTFSESYEKKKGDEYYAAYESFRWNVHGTSYAPAKKRIDLNYPYLGSQVFVRFVYHKKE